MSHDAVILAGGSSRRLDAVDKTALTIGGATLLDRAVAAVPDAGVVVVVADERPLATAREVRWCREDPPGGGPVAALAAGLAATAADVVLVLAADLPWIGPAVDVLLAAVPADGADGAGGVAALVDAQGRVNHLAAAWRRATLLRALDGVGRVSGSVSGAAMRRLLDGVRVVEVPDTGGWGQDCDTWDDVAAARARAGDQRP